ncbi:MAG: restriction endonuclease subunit S [Candidatus Peribacteria bacterium]|nr:restriction endonuclease subunit S [Candidatus Peribacteria bacterium]
MIKFNSNQIINTYLLHLLKSHYFDTLIVNHRGGTQKFVALSDIRDFSIPLPPLPLQQHFSDLITQIETIKTDHRHALATLETLYQSQLQDSFQPLC